MEPNLERALSYGPEWLLAKLANLPVDVERTETLEAAEQFRRDYCELYPGLEPIDYCGYAQIFRQAWTARTPNELEAMGMHLQRIFERESGLPRGDSWDDPRSRPAVVVDFAAGEITVRPRTLLDWLASWLLIYRKQLALCASGGCPHPYYVKAHPRQQFCSLDCADGVRMTKKKSWWNANRETFLEKWRNERRAAKYKAKGRRRKRSKRLAPAMTRPRSK